MRSYIKENSYNLGEREHREVRQEFYSGAYLSSLWEEYQVEKSREGVGEAISLNPLNIIFFNRVGDTIFTHLSILHLDLTVIL